MLQQHLKYPRLYYYNHSFCYTFNLNDLICCYLFGQNPQEAQRQNVFRIKIKAGEKIWAEPLSRAVILLWLTHKTRLTCMMMCVYGQNLYAQLSEQMAIQMWFVFCVLMLCLSFLNRYRYIRCGPGQEMWCTRSFLCCTRSENPGYGLLHF